MKESVSLKKEMKCEVNLEMLGSSRAVLLRPRKGLSDKDNSYG